MQTIIIGENEAGQRLDRFLRKYLVNASLSSIYTAIRKDVRVDGRRRSQEYMLALGDEVNFYFSDETLARLSARPIGKKIKRQFGIVFEDENLIVVGKPPGLLMYGNESEKKNTLASQVVSYLIDNGSYSPRNNPSFTPSPINRLDMNTSGLVIFGKNYQSLKTLNEMMRARTAIDKYYLALVCGKLEGEIFLKDELTKDRTTNKVEVNADLNASTKARTALTLARPLSYKQPKMSDSRPLTLVEVKLVTGRTHQIRSQLANAGYPILGDTKYGLPGPNKWARQNWEVDSQLLHAYKLIINYGLDNLSYLSGKEFMTPPPSLHLQV